MVSGTDIFMDLKGYYRKLREMEKGINEEFVVGRAWPPRTEASPEG